MEKKEIIVLALLFMVCFYLWTLPLKDNKMPFSEGDGAYHFSYGDYISSTDKAMGIDGLPGYISMWYKDYNPIIGPNASLYPPSYHLAEGITESFGGERILSPFLFIAITCFIITFSIYFLIRELYGFWPALISSFALIFCYRSILTYSWGQRPCLTAFMFIPLILYSFYKYINSVLKNEEKISYFYITVLLLCSVYLLHLRGLLFALPTIAVFLILIWIKEKKFPFDFKKNYKHLIIAAIIISLIVIPFFNIYYGSFKGHYVGEDTQYKERDFSSLFSWFKKADVDTGYPEHFTLFNQEYGGWWNNVLLLIGIFFVFYRRNKSDLLMISWLFAVYINLHVNFFLGVGNYGDERQLIQESYLFYPLIAIGVTTIPSLFKIPKERKQIIIGVLSIAFMMLIVLTTGKAAYEMFSGTYQGVLRITPQQYTVSEWINNNLPANAIVYDEGTLTFPKKRWMQVLSWRYFLTKPTEAAIKNVTATHLLFDYSDLNAIGYVDEINRVQEIEKNMTAGKKLLYDVNNIKIYEV